MEGFRSFSRRCSFPSMEAVMVGNVVVITEVRNDRLRNYRTVIRYISIHKKASSSPSRIRKILTSRYL